MTTRPLQYRWLNKSLLSSRRRKRRDRGPAQPATTCGCYDIGGGIGARPSAFPGQQPRQHQRAAHHRTAPPAASRAFPFAGTHTRHPGVPPAPDSHQPAASRALLLAGTRTRPPGVIPAPDSHQSAASRLRSRGYAPTSGKTASGQTAFGHEPVWAQKITNKHLPISAPARRWHHLQGWQHALEGIPKKGRQISKGGSLLSQPPRVGGERRKPNQQRSRNFLADTF